MVGMISERGLLSIRRKGMWVKQGCRYRVGQRCGHHCPLFEEGNSNVDEYVNLYCGSHVTYIHINKDNRPIGGEESGKEVPERG